MIHYGLNQSELQALYKSTGLFATAKTGLAHLCGNGNYHAYNTKEKAQVTCTECLKKLNK